MTYKYYFAVESGCQWQTAIVQEIWEVEKLTEASPGTEIILQFRISAIPSKGLSAMPFSKPSITRLWS